MAVTASPSHPRWWLARMNDEVTIVILAGGESSRMGRDKSFVELGGKPLIAHVIERVSQLGLPILILANESEPYQAFGLPVRTDVFPLRSSLNGLYSALMHSPSEYTICVACDMPFLNPQLLAYLISLREGYDAVVPVVGGHPQGLHAVYRKNCLDVMRGQLEQNHLRIRDLYERFKTRRVDEDDMRRFDKDLTAFENVNTPEALRAAELSLHRPE
ncbi:MAG: molybdenum cofactor guanylyltransferase [Anaerolineae bacterium]|nr:molybdenum cofactor guanylyltransferase [Anaerolineae bacterium]